MENEKFIEIQKHTSFLVEQFEHELMKAANLVIEKYGLEPEDLDTPGELAPEDYNEDSSLEWYEHTSDWKFYIREALDQTNTLVIEALELNKDV